jgi:hypothetical protein
MNRMISLARFMLLITGVSLVLSGCYLPKSIPTATPVLTGATVTTVPAGPTDTFTPVSSAPTDTPTPTQVPTSSFPMVSALDKDVNCRFGPSTNFAAVGFLKVGVTVPIHGTDQTHGWWQIQNPQDIVGHYCWLGGSVTKTSGDISHLPIIPIPQALVTDASITLTPVIHGTCGGPNAQGFTAHITTNGPTTVNYYIQIFNSDNTSRTPQLPGTLTFASASTQDFDPGGAYKTDCGSYYIMLVVTSPNSISSKTDWKVVSP